MLFNNMKKQRIQIIRILYAFLVHKVYFSYLFVSQSIHSDLLTNRYEKYIFYMSSTSFPYSLYGFYMSYNNILYTSTDK